MRLHTLEITAFGPFAETVSVDFDALSEASVFLLCGDTGAGKTTVLDAVCFALFGDVPSERSAAKQLRSQHATEAAVPRVMLQATLSGRRFRLTRSPQWQRPKKRGAGRTTEQARVLVEELVDERWVSLTNRLDEAGHLVTGLLGMNLAQFSQVVLLPQGQFDTFLRATSDERHAVLTQLFRTQRFEEVERWLAERRTTLRRGCESHGLTVIALLHRISEVAGVDLPREWADLGEAADDHRIAAWVSELTEATTVELTAAENRLSTVSAAHARAAGRHDEGRQVHELRTRHDRARRVVEALAADAADARGDRQRLVEARRADAVRPFASVASDSSAAADGARSAANRAVQAVAEMFAADPHSLADDTALDDTALAQRARDATQRAAVARSFVPRARKLTDAHTRRAALEVTARQVARERVSGRQQVAVLLGRIGSLTEQVDRLRDRAALVGEARRHVTEIGRRVASFAVVSELEFQVATFRAKRDAQREVTLGLREELVELRESRLHGMAAELAAAMAVGQDCPVCGSCDHPSPASWSPGAPTRSDEQELRNRVDDAEVLLETHNDHVRGYQGRLDHLRSELGPGTSEESLAELQQAERAHADARQSAVELASAERELADAVRSERELTQTVSRLDADLRVTREQQAAVRLAADALADELASILGHASDDVSELDQLIRRNERAATLLTAARDALVEQTRRTEHAAESAEAAARSAFDQGFPDLPTALVAVLDEAECAELEARLDARQRAETEAESVLAEPGVGAAAGADAPDLGELARARDEADRTLTEATATLRLVDRRQDRLAVQARDLRSALDAWGPQRTEYLLVRSLAELVEGKGVENTRQMRLSAYVLAARLSQVVAAANERLARMTDDRYLLEHTAQRGVGERRGGLSLLVRDQWTDEQRDPVTLSGGETFVVSLALALGLADVVTGEAGGARIETLFVDEGFGSLDSDTLELVMDTLDQLREGGRVVGVVSHVPELRTRIPTQLVVSKTRAGSTLDQRLGAG